MGDVLAGTIKERERQEMIRGYREMAALNRTLADEATNEVWPRYA